jgi:hypothetical protein
MLLTGTGFAVGVFFQFLDSAVICLVLTFYTPYFRKAARVVNKRVLTGTLQSAIFVFLFLRNNKHVVSLENVKFWRHKLLCLNKIIENTLYVSLEIDNKFRLVTNNLWSFWLNCTYIFTAFFWKLSQINNNIWCSVLSVRLRKVADYRDCSMVVSINIFLIQVKRAKVWQKWMFWACCLQSANMYLPCLVFVTEYVFDKTDTEGTRLECQVR